APPDAEAALQLRDVLALADQDRAPPRASEAEDVLRHDVVARPEEADQGGGDHERRRREPERVERVPGAEAERERQHGHEDERGDDPPQPAAELALRVETVPPEHEQRHEHEERQPFRLGLPRHAPEDVVLVVEPAQDERDVETERKACEVEEDEGGDARRPPERQTNDAPREDGRARAPDVLDRSGRVCRDGFGSGFVRGQSRLRHDRAIVRGTGPGRTARNGRSRSTPAATTLSRSDGVRRSASRRRAMRNASERRRSRRSLSWKYTWTSGSASVRGSARASIPIEWVLGTSTRRRPDGSSSLAGASRWSRGAASSRYGGSNDVAVQSV